MDTSNNLRLLSSELNQSSSDTQNSADLSSYTLSLSSNQTDDEYDSVRNNSYNSDHPTLIANNNDNNHNDNDSNYHTVSHNLNINKNTNDNKNNNNNDNNSNKSNSNDPNHNSKNYGSNQNVMTPRSLTLWAKIRRFLAIAFVFLGPGQLVAVGYIDPGNWATDIAGGAQAGYVHLFIILASNIIAIVLQTLSLNLGSVSGKDLAQQCRASLHPVVNTLLWISCEIAIMATDMAEVIGSAIALNLLFGLPIAAGVALTGMDVFIILLGLQNKLAYVELLITVLVTFVFGSLVAVMIKSEPNGTDVLLGYLPASASLVTDSKTLYTAVGIIGATVMPHNLYLHSAVAREHFQKSFSRHRPSNSQESLTSATSSTENENVIVEDDAELVPLQTLSRDSNNNSNGSNGKNSGNNNNNNNSNVINIDNNHFESDSKSLANKSYTSSNTANSNADTNAGATDLVDTNAKAPSLLTSPINFITFAFSRFWSLAREDPHAPPTEELYDPLAPPLSTYVDIQSIKRFLFKSKIGLIVSLMLACIINSSILIVAGCNFYYKGQTDEQGIEDAYYLLETVLGNGWAIIFALSLLAAGQSATITGTLAGAAVMEGFLNIRVKPWLRRIITRGLAIIPAMVVAIAVGDSGIDQLLVLSQVILSVQLPFSIFPLVYFTSKKEIMSSFVNPKYLTVICYIIATVLAVGNFYVLSQL